MPEVGVLNLTIHDNSETAAEGLERLTGALVSIQSAIGNGLKLSGVAGPLNKFANTVSANSKTFANVGTFLNAMKDYQKAFKDAENVKFNTQPIKDLKEAISDGIKIGNAGTQINKIKEALGGGWDTAQSANIKTVLQDISEGAKSMQGTNLGTTAKNVSATAKALAEYAQAASMVKTTLGDNATKAIGDYASATSEPVKQMKRDVIDYQNVMNELKDVQESTKITFKEPLLPLNLQFHAGEDDLGKAHEGFTKIEQEVHTATDAVVDFNVRLQEVGDTLTSIKVNPFEEMYHTFSAMASEFDWFRKESMRLMGGESPLLLGDGRTPGQLLLGDGQDPQTFLSTWVDTAEQWKQNWVFFASEAAEEMRAQFQTDWIWGGKPVPQSMQTFHLGAGSSPLLLGSGGVPHENALSTWIDNSEQWNPDWVFSEGAIDGVKTATQVVEDSKEATDEAKQSLDDFYNSLNKLELLKKLRDIVTEKFGKALAKGKLDDEGIVNYQLKIANLTAQIDKLTEAERGTSVEAINMAKDDITKYLGYNEIELTRKKYEELTDAIARQVAAGKMNEAQFIDKIKTLQNLREKLQELEEEEKRASSFSGRLSDAWGKLKDGVKRMFPSLTQLLSRFKQIVKYRMIRSVIRHITAGFTEGIKNVYEYNKAIGGSFAPAMDSAATAIAQMKNSLGASLAPAIQAVIPYVNQLVNWFITLVNYVNQFFALLNGQATWTRALPATVNAFGKQEKAAKSAGAAMKDLLADWDELNIIQSQSGGGGGAGSATAAEDYLKMFEEVGKFDNRVKDVVNFVKDNFDTIKSLAAGIGAAILAWKLSKAFDQSLGFLRTLEIATGITLLVNGVKLTTAAGYDIGKNGINSDNLLNAVGGVFETALGTGLVGVAFGGIKGGVLGLTVGTSLALLALAASMDEGEKDKLYGGIELTADDIQEEVDKLFTFDVNAALSNAQIDHETLTKAQTDVQNALIDANADFVTFKMKLTPESALELLSSVNKVVDQTNALLKIFQKNISVGFGFDVNYDDPKLAQKFSTDNITGLEGYITELGNSIGQILQDGIVDSIEEQAILDDLMGKLSRVSEAIALGEASGRFTSELEKGNYGRDWTSVDRQSLINYANKYKEQLRLTEEAGYLQAKDTKASLGGIYYGMLQREADNPGTYTSEQLKEAEIAYKEYKVDDVTKKFVDEATADGRKIFIENMMTAFGSAIEKLNESGMRTDLLTKGPGGLAEGKIGLEEWIEGVLATNLGWDKNDFGDILDLMGMSGLDMLSEKIKSQYISRIIQTLGRESDTYTRLKDELKIPVDEILSIDKASWDGWTSKTQKNYITALSKAYGGREVIEGFKRAGYTADQLMGVIGQFSGSSKDSLVKAIEDVYGGVITTVQNDIAKETKNDNPMSRLDIFGLSFQAPTEEEKKIIEKADFERAVKNDNPMGWMDIFGLSYTPPTEDNVAVPVVVTPEFEVEISDETIDEVRRGIQEALMDDGRMDIYEMDALDSKFGMDLVNKIWAQLEEEGMNPDGTFGKIPAGMRVASTGINYGPNNVPVNYAPSGENNTIVTEPKDPQQEINNTASGVERGNRNLEGLMRDLLAAMNRVGDRPITVSLFPSSGWGNTNRQSEKKMEEVTGYNG